MQNIALVIPTYNSVKTIEETLDSVLQTQGQFLGKISAVYIADDCSNDGTITLVKTKCNASIPMYILQGEQNLGERKNVNNVINLIKGTTDWFLILHSDDIAKPNWLEMMISRIEACSENVGSICSSWDNLMLDGSINPGEDDASKQVGVIEGNDEAVRGTLLKGCWWHISGCAIRVKAFEDCGVFNPKLPQLGDWEWLLRCLHSGWSVEYIPRTLILYRQNPTSVSSKSFQTHRDIREFMEILPNYINLLESTELLHLYMKQIKFMSRRLIKSLITLNTKRFLLSFQVLFMLLNSLRKSQQSLKS
ncbi:putative glycosyltransferase [Cylindrospermum stagnale PCC 7417]|uniref:Putative glycosyltransferase n=1 Tax=Cylindrospermum stagnale PCC 7417 TaxID=56107 RepID=K9X749_9NOST|nr:glycosyltransferase [Cylindrospermum stagnale]AFZ27929.1 putative glycosyltransferase [Cylindrospermum stagnale PCC 7417]